VAWLRLWASRDFTASAPNVKYVGDITYLPLATGTNLYLATVIDCCSRRVAGWAIAEHMRTKLVADAWRPFTGYRRYQVVSNCLLAGCSAVLSGGMFHGWVGGHGDCGAGGVQVHDLG